jgi:hypothetical protein
VSAADARRGINEALFREINERLEALGQTFARPQETVDFICECANPECADRIGMTLSEYESVRAEPTRFAVKPGHADTEVEAVVSETDRFVVVDKRDRETVAVSRDTDPRA